jgi:hypothetical protein
MLFCSRGQLICSSSLGVGRRFKALPRQTLLCRNSSYERSWSANGVTRCKKEDVYFVLSLCHSCYPLLICEIIDVKNVPFPCSTKENYSVPNVLR